MNRRRKDQPPIDALPTLTARFLNRLIALRGITQAQVAKELLAAPGTISRIFRGVAPPSDQDLEKLSTFLHVPIGNLLCVMILDNTSRERPMLAASGAFRHMLSDTRTVVVAGTTMSTRISQLRDARLDGTDVLISCVEPTVLGDIEANARVDGWHSGSLRSSFLMTITTVIAKILVAKSRGCKVHGRLWVRKNITIDDDPHVGQIAANDWIAIENPPAWETPTVRVSFYGDRRWNEYVEPLMIGLRSESGEGELVWDSDWSPLDKRMGRLRRHFEAAHQALSVDSLVSGPPSCTP